MPPRALNTFVKLFDAGIASPHFNYSPSSLDNFRQSGQFGSGMVKSQSLTAFPPHQPSPVNGEFQFETKWRRFDAFLQHTSFCKSVSRVKCWSSGTTTDFNVSLAKSNQQIQSVSKHLSMRENSPDSFSSIRSVETFLQQTLDFLLYYLQHIINE